MYETTANKASPCSICKAHGSCLIEFITILMLQYRGFHPPARASEGVPCNPPPEKNKGGVQRGGYLQPPLWQWRIHCDIKWHGGGDVCDMCAEGCKMVGCVTIFAENRYAARYFSPLLCILDMSVPPFSRHFIS